MVPTIYLKLGEEGGGFKKHLPLESSFPMCHKYILGIGKPPNGFRVTPNDLKDSESKWLKEELPKKYNTDIKLFHYGHEKIQVLLDGYPALKKNYYGKQVDGCLQDYGTFCLAKMEENLNQSPS